MPIVCPKCGHVRSNNDDPLIPDWKCPACGVVYQKITNNQNINPNHLIKPTPFNLKKVLITSGILTVAFIIGLAGFASYYQLKLDEQNKNITAKRLQDEKKAEQRKERIAAQNEEQEKIKNQREAECLHDADCTFRNLQTMPQILCRDAV